MLYTHPDRPVILLTERHASVRRSLAEMLRGEGLVVLPAENGARALAAAQSHAGPIDVFLCDLDQPEADAADTARRLQLALPGLRVIVTSARPPRWDRLEPDWDFLGKPFSLALMLAHLADLLPASELYAAAPAVAGPGLAI